MNPREFYETVKSMRSAQRKVDEWYKNGEHDSSGSYWFREKARLEKTIDAEIERVEDILRKKKEAQNKVKNIVKTLNDKGFGLEEVKT